MNPWQGIKGRWFGAIFIPDGAYLFGAMVIFPPGWTPVPENGNTTEGLVIL